MPLDLMKEPKTEAVNGNRLAATSDGRQALIDGLNEDLAGGEPTTQPRPAPRASQPPERLDCALRAEIQAIEIGLKVLLETQIADETRHKEKIERIIVGWYEAALIAKAPAKSRLDSLWRRT